LLARIFTWSLPWLPLLACNAFPKLIWMA